MAMPPTSHAFDETGTLPENKISNEERVLPNYPIRGLVAKFGSFYTDSFAMKDALGNLVPGDKYHFGLFNELITEKTGKTIAAAVIILDSTIQSPVYIDYQCVGGPYGASNEYIIDLFNQINNDNREVSWPNILGKPDHYKPAHHLQDIGDLYGAEYFVAALDRLKNAVLMGDNASHDEIFKIIDNNVSDINDTINNEVTIINNIINDLENNLNNQIDDLDTKVDNNYTNIQNELTIINNNITTLQTNLINQINALNDKVDNNFDVLQDNITDVQNWVSNTVVPSLQSSINNVSNALSAHIADKNNPHNVTAAQTGAYTKAEVDTIVQNIDLSLYVKKSTAEDRSVHIFQGAIFIFANGVWRQVWPPLWQ